jgi:diadenylate cyclase
VITAFNIGFLQISWVDVIDILLVSFLLYQVYKLMQGSVALRVFIGFLFLYLIYLVVRAAEMELLSSILGQFMGVGVLAAIILFQQEIRKFLLILGRTSVFSGEGNFNLPWRKNINGQEFNITPIIEAAKSLGGSNTGALIVFSKNSELKFYAESGDLIDAIVSKRLLLAIFNKHSPLHDGAGII